MTKKKKKKRETRGTHCDKTMSERASSSAADDDVPSTTGKNSGEDEDPQSQTQSGHGTDTNTKRTNTEKRFTESIQERYSVGRLLGEGAFSIVRKAKRRKDGFVCALKIIDKKDSEESTDFRSEIDILCKVDHPNCVAFYEWTEVRITCCCTSSYARALRRCHFVHKTMPYKRLHG